MNGGRGGWEMNAKSGLVETFGLQGGGLGAGYLADESCNTSKI